MQIISLGVGVQSSTLVLMSERGEITPPADAAIFADTGFERDWTYAYLDYLKSVVKMPILTCSNGNIQRDSTNPKLKHRDMIPAFTRTNEGKGMLKRQCTRAYKIDPIRRTIRDTFGFQPYELWLGISVDEVARAAPSRVNYVKHRFPLLERRFARRDCTQWLHSHGYEIPGRSSCICCPLRSKREWLEMKERQPDEFQKAVDFDEAIRDNHIQQAQRLNFPLYIHKDTIPLRDIGSEADTQLTLWDLEAARNEDCEGGCFL